MPVPRFPNQARPRNELGKVILDLNRVTFYYQSKLNLSQFCNLTLMKHDDTMKAYKFADGFLVKVERGEEITAALTDFLREKRIHAGIVTGLGGIGDAELGFYDLPSRTYLRKTIPGNLELVYYMGNITLVDGEPFIHAHAVVSGPDYMARSGHFFSARVVITGEFVIRPADWEVTRSLDDAVGLKLMDIPE